MTAPSGPDEWADRVGAAVRDRAGELRLTLGEVARRSDIDPSTLSTFINGHHEPHPRTLTAIEVDGLEWQPRTLRKIMNGEASADLSRYALKATPVRLTLDEMIEAVEESSIAPTARAQIVGVIESLRDGASTTVVADDDTDQIMDVIKDAVAEHVADGRGQGSRAAG